MPIRVATVRAADVPSSQTDFTFYVDPARVGVSPLTLAEINSSRWYTDTDLVTQMAREIVSVSEAHGKYASFTSTSKIAIDYDGIRADYAVSDTFGRNNVWTGQRAVYHLNDVNDSTSNAYTLTNNGTTLFVAAKIANGADFGIANTTKSLRINNDIGITGGNITMSGLVKLNTEIASITYPLIMQGDSGTHVNYFITYEYNGGTRRLIFNRQRQAISNNQINHNITLGTDNWNHIALTYDGTTMRGFVNGVQVGTLTTSGNGSAYAVDRLLIGADLGQRNVDEASTTQDETRVSSSVQTANWLLTEYNNQSDEATFWGDWTTFGGGPAAVNARRLFLMMA